MNYKRGKDDRVGEGVFLRRKKVLFLAGTVCCFGFGKGEFPDSKPVGSVPCYGCGGGGKGGFGLGGGWGVTGGL